MFHQVHRGLPAAWHQPRLAAHVGVALGVRDELNRLMGAAHSHAHQVVLRASGERLQALRVRGEVWLGLFYFFE